MSVGAQVILIDRGHSARIWGKVRVGAIASLFLALLRDLMSFATIFFDEVSEIARAIDRAAVDRLAAALAAVRQQGGRLFLLGVGGSAGNCSHAVNDFRKLCGFEAYTPVDNVSELTARTNDEGWDTIFSAWLETSRFSDRDAILVFSVGGGDVKRNISPNLVKAIDLAKARGAKVFGVVGRPTGYTATVGDEVIIIPIASAARVTPHSEAFQAVVWHCLVSHPLLQKTAAKWESLTDDEERR